MRFIADESCDFKVVSALRAAGHDVVAVCETRPGTPDREVLAWARDEGRICIAEDRDFGWLVFAAGERPGAGVLFVRCPERARRDLPARLVAEVARLGDEIAGAFVVWSPDRTRVIRLQGGS